MRKIPTLFVRDPANLRAVTTTPHPDCRWVLDGEGIATRKYDGTCVAYLPLLLGDTSGGTDGHRPEDLTAAWFARREVKPGNPAPDGFVPVHTDPVTGKTVGWEPIEQSPFAAFHADAIAHSGDIGIVNLSHGPLFGPRTHSTYELVGPKINGNPEGRDRHTLVRHGYNSADDQAAIDTMPRDPDGLRAWLLDHDRAGWEGIVWHHPDGRMAKLKRRDYTRPDNTKRPGFPARTGNPGQEPVRRFHPNTDQTSPR